MVQQPLVLVLIVGIAALLLVPPAFLLRHWWRRGGALKAVSIASWLFLIGATVSIALSDEPRQVSDLPLALFGLLLFWWGYLGSVAVIAHVWQAGTRLFRVGGNR